MRVPWTARRSNQSILKEISPEYSLEGLMLRLQYFGHWWEGLIHLKRPWCWERLKAGGEGDDRGWDGWMASPIEWTWVWVKARSWWWTGRPGVPQSMGLQRVGHDWVTELNWASSPLLTIITGSVWCVSFYLTCSFILDYLFFIFHTSQIIWYFFFFLSWSRVDL